MATVTGVTAARAQEIEDASVIGASIQGNDLVLMTHGGTQINVGRIIPPLVNSYPVGSIYMTTRSDNPATYMGGGTWQRWGKGRVPVSLDETQGETFFESVEKTGGQKTYAMTVAEMPSHNHGGATQGQNQSHSHTGYTSTDGNHNHQYNFPNVPTLAAGGGMGVADDVAHNRTSGDGGSHNHSIQTYDANQDHTHAITSQGGSTPVAGNNLQPYITCYMWKRTA